MTTTKVEVRTTEEVFHSLRRAPQTITETIEYEISRRTQYIDHLIACLTAERDAIATITDDDIPRIIRAGVAAVGKDRRRNFQGK